MKRKKTVGASAPDGKALEAQVRVLEEKPFSPWDAVQICLFAVLLFLTMTVQTAWMSVALPVLALVLSVGRGPLRRMRERCCLPVWGFILYGAACGCAAVYASFGEYAVNEFYKIIAAFSLGTVVLTRFEKRHVRGLLWSMAAVCAVISLISTDAASGGPFYAPFLRLMEALGTTYEGVEQLVWGSRVTGIYNDANISAGILALGCICGLHLSLTGIRRWERGLACILTGMSGLGFFLAVSRGAMLCFGLALLVYLGAVGAQERMRLFFLIVLNTLVTIGISMPVTAVSAMGTFLPDAATLLCGLPVFLLYEFPALWLARKLEGRGKMLAFIAAALVAVVGVYTMVGLQVHGPFTFPSVARLYRYAELPAGIYTLTADYDSGRVAINIGQGPEFENLKENMIRYEDLDEPLTGEVTFTVEEPGKVMFVFWGTPGAVLRSASLSDGTEIPLDYPLLPGFLLERLQNGLRQDGSFTGRIQYDRDGWILFTRSPLIGKGLGSTEGLLTSVQPFFYESKYLHNHVLQVLCDCGLLGGVPFLVFLLGSAWLLVRRLRKSWKKGGDPLAAALLGVWVMMNAHGLMELNFSIRAYQCLAYSLLLLPVLVYHPRRVAAEAVREDGFAKKTAHRARWGGTAALACMLVYLGVFAAALESHRIVQREMETFTPSGVQEFFQTTRSWIRRDLFDREQNQLNFVGNAVLLDDSRYNGDMLRYVEDLRASGTYAACTGLAEYYYLPRGEWEEVFACSREAVAQEASSKDAWNQQVEFYRDTLLPQVEAVDAGVYLDGVLALKTWLEEYNQDRREEIELTEANQAFLNQVERAREAGLEDVAALMYLSLPSVSQ